MTALARCLAPLLIVLAQDTSTAWRSTLERAASEKKPIVVFFRPDKCAPCDEFERRALVHPTIERRLDKVVFTSLSTSSPVGTDAWGTGDPGLALFDYSGTVRARWRVMPDTMRLGIILDSASAIAPHLQRVVQLTESGAKTEADAVLEEAMALIGRRPEAIRSVAVAPASGGAIRILPLPSQVVSGRHTVRTHIATTSIARVDFFLDGRAVTKAKRPPFAASIEFGRVPERHTIRAVAFDRSGREIARDERIVNDAGEAFWIRIVEPREGGVAGSVRVGLSLRVPPSQSIKRVSISWNDAERAVLRTAPFEATVAFPEGQTGVLRAAAELTDGRVSEDAVLLNAGAVEHADVQLVELPVTILNGDALDASRVSVLEGTKRRAVEAISPAAETPLTIGLMIDTSESMQKTLPDVQETAMSFLDAVLSERDRAFLIRFSSRAALVQPATYDRALLQQQIIALQPRGLTALYDATALGLLQFEGVKGRRALVLLTDGLDRTSEYTAAEVRELARRAHVPIHVIAAVAEVPAELRDLAESTGGTLHVLRDLAELPGVYARIETALRAQVLVFVRTERALRENEWRPIRVETSAKDAQVFAPSGYYAPW